MKTPNYWGSGEALPSKKMAALACLELIIPAGHHRQISVCVPLGRVFNGGLNTFQLTKEIFPMIGFLLKIAVLVVIGVLSYNFFFGTEDEKAQSSKVFGQVKEVAVSVGDLAKSEKEKFDAGKFDTAIEKLGKAYKVAREGAQDLDAGILKRIGELEKRKETLKKEIASIEKAEHAEKKGQNSEAKSAAQQLRKEKLQREMEQLIADSNAVLLKQSPN
jgi:hypothetical protein